MGRGSDSVASVAVRGLLVFMIGLGRGLVDAPVGAGAGAGTALASRSGVGVGAGAPKDRRVCLRLSALDLGTGFEAAFVPGFFVGFFTCSFTFASKAAWVIPIFPASLVQGRWYSKAVDFDSFDGPEWDVIVVHTHTPPALASQPIPMSPEDW